MFTRIDCLALDLLLEGQRTLQDQKLMADNENSLPSALSAWHCQQKCRLDVECDLFSWKKPLASSNTTATGNECRLFKSQDSVDVAVSFQSGWQSSARDCNTFHDYFNSKCLIMQKNQR